MTFIEMEELSNDLEESYMSGDYADDDVEHIWAACVYYTDIDDDEEEEMYIRNPLDKTVRNQRVMDLCYRF